jgi:hypothetical protein
MKKIRGDKSTGVIIHAWKISQGNFLCNYLYLKLKCHGFHFIFSLFPPMILENRRAEQVLPGRGSVGEGWHQWEEGGVGEKGVGG